MPVTTPSDLVADPMYGPQMPLMTSSHTGVPGPSWLFQCAENSTIASVGSASFFFFFGVAKSFYRASKVVAESSASLAPSMSLSIACWMMFVNVVLGSI